MRVTVIAAILFSLNAQQAQRSTADGVYSPDQAERGRGRYAATCQGCHAADLSGGVGSALKGDQFKSDWGGLPLARLFERIRTMPPGAPAPQPEDAAVELLAHVLAANGFPPGETLSIERLDDIRFQSAERSDAVPDFALVQVFGCITSRTPGEWLITSATAPVRTTNPEPSPGGRTTAPRSQPRRRHVPPLECLSEPGQAGRASGRGQGVPDSRLYRHDQRHSADQRSICVPMNWELGTEEPRN